jgi:hypothetical protein
MKGTKQIFGRNFGVVVVVLPESDDDLGCSVKVAQVPADDGRPNETGEDGFAFVVTGRRDNQMRHPRTHLT